MAYLTINNMTLPVRFEDGKRQDDSLITQPRTMSGGFTNEIRARRHRYDVSTRLLTLDEAIAWEQIFRGVGHTWSFDVDLYSSKSLLLTSSGNAARVTAHPKFGAGNVEITTSSVSYWSEATPYGWTVGVWHYDTGTWVHRLETSNGTQWEDGVQGTYGWSLAPGAGIFSLGVGEWDDLVYLPVAITDDMGDEWPLAEAYSSLPTLTLDGDIVYNVPVSARAMWGSIDTEDTRAGSTMQTMRALSVTLREE